MYKVKLLEGCYQWITGNDFEIHDRINYGYRVEVVCFYDKLLLLLCICSLFDYDMVFDIYFI
jgi:hypothetical protein